MDNGIQKKHVFITIGFVLLSFFIIKQIFFFKPGFLEKTIHNISYPVIVVANYVTKPIKNLFSTIRQYKNIKNKYQILLKNHYELTNKHIQLSATTHHYNSIKELLEFQKQYNLENTVMAKIILKNITDSEHFFLINKGRTSNIKINMLVLNEFQIVGRISRVHSFYSKVTLITDSKSKISAYTEQTNTTGIVQGSNKINQCNLSYVSHLSKIENDEYVISSGQGLVFPEGFCLGKIAKHKKKDLYHKIKIEPIINLKEIESCIVLNNPK